MTPKDLPPQLYAEITRATRLRSMALAVTVGLIAAGLYLAWAHLDILASARGGIFIPIMWVLFVPYTANRWLRSTQTARIAGMFVEQASDWTFTYKIGNAKTHDLARQGLIPKGQQLEVRAHIHGHIDRSEFEIWHVEALGTPRKGTLPGYGLGEVASAIKTPFKGYVFRILRPAPMTGAQVFVGGKDGALKIQPADLDEGAAETDTQPAPLPDSPQAQAPKERIAKTNQLFSDGAKFHAARLLPSETLIVIRDSSPPLEIGGLFWTRDRYRQRFEEIANEFARPSQLAKIWTEPDKT